MKGREIGYRIFIAAGAFAFVMSFVCNMLRKKNEFIRDISSYNLSDTISNIYDNKDDWGPGKVTKFRGKDSLRFCFYGVNDSSGAFYPSFAKPGDVIFKKVHSDSFYLKRNEEIFWFKIEKYQ